LPKSIWCYESVLSKALHYNQRSKFAKNHAGAYRAAIREGWLDEVCKHMPTPNRWTFNNVQSLALTCKTKTEFAKKHGGAYSAVRKRQWIDEITTHMIPRHKVWTLDYIHTLALQHTSKSSFNKAYSRAYTVALNNDWLDSVTTHMIDLRGRSRGTKHQKQQKWDYDSTLKKAIRYSMRQDFRIHAPKAYSAAQRNGWLDSVCSHMKPESYFNKSKPRNSG
jgi:hypothetical protein